MIRRILLTATVAVALQGAADDKGAITPSMLDGFKASYEDNAANRARHNALNAAGIEKLAFNEKVRNKFDDHFSHKVETKGITDQKSSGRCWLFTGLNVL
ncbi:MAG: aminopeptidase, partial [Muribaculaceae bacterium]|nr:aminopeptidase [Muribaculaceae bacterium]